MSRLGSAFERFLNRLHITEGAFVLVIVSFIFTTAVYKIDHNSIQRFDKFQGGVCSLVSQSNKQGTSATKHRLQAAADRYTAQAAAERKIESVWKYAQDQQPANTPESQKKLVQKLIDGQQALVDLNTQAAADLQKQADAVKPLEIAGC